MANGDFKLLTEGAFGGRGAHRYNVSSGTTASIKAGELVLRALGATNPTVWTASNTAKPVVATDFVLGLSTSASTETASLAGTVDVMPLTNDMVLLGNPDTAATWNTQAKYDALVGSRVLLSTTSGGVQTVLAADSATSGLVVQPLDVSKYPAKVAISLRAGCSDLT